MKKIFLAIAIFALASTASAQIDTTGMKLNKPLLEIHVQNVCHAVPTLVWAKAKKEVVKKYRSSERYKISQDGQSWKEYSPLEGEKVLSYKGIIFYSVTYKSLIMKATSGKNQNAKAKKVRPERTYEEKAQRNEQLMQVAGAVMQAGQRVIYQQRQRQNW